MNQFWMGVVCAASCAVVMSASAQQQATVGVVRADEHSCAALTQLISEAGALSAWAKKYKGTSGKPHRYTFVATSEHCVLPGDVATPWSVEAADGEICRRTTICMLEFPVGPG